MKFEDINIHQHLISKLQSSIEAGRIPHAQYFQGEEGSGNLPLAIAYANELLSGPADMFGGVDDRAAKLIHPDLHIVFPVVQGTTKISAPQLNDFREAYIGNPFLLFSEWLDQNDAVQKSPIISVSEAGEMYNKLSLKSFEGGYKVLIIWQAELMNIACSNKMLKLIEEPPDKTVIILCGSDINQLLPTIISRVQLVEVKQNSSTELSVYLQSKYPEFSNAQYTMAIEEAEGSLGKALHLLRSSDEDEFFERYRELLRIALVNNMPGALKWIDDTVKMGKAFQKSILVYGLEIYRQANLNNFVPEKVKIQGEKEQFIEKFSPFINSINIERLMTANNQAHYKLSRNGYAKLVFFEWIIQLMRLIKK